MSAVWFKEIVSLEAKVAKTSSGLELAIDSLSISYNLNKSGNSVSWKTA